MRVKDVMTRDVITVPPAMRLKELASVLAKHRISGVPVVDETGAVIGVVSEGDIVLKQAGRSITDRSPLDWIFGERPSSEEMRRHAATTVGQAMTSPAVTIGAERSVHEAAALMVDRKLNRLPVVADGRLIGIITRADIVRAHLRRDEDAARFIRDEVIRRTMWLDPDVIDVEVREGIARISGKVDRRSTATILEKLIGIVDGVDHVESYLTWEFDDSRIEPVDTSDVVRAHHG